MKNKMVEAIPLPKKDKEENEIKKKLVDENDEENNDREDDLICVRLTEGSIRNIDITNNIDNENNNNNNNPFDFLGEKDNSNNLNTNNTNQGGNLDLLDLNNIFSSSGASTTNTNANNDNNNANNNNSMNPFDLLNLQLDQTNNNNNSNNIAQPTNNNNNNINDLLNMVMNTNNNSNNNNGESNNNNDILSQIQMAPQQETNAVKECFKNEDISLYYSITKKEGNNIDGSVFASNNNKEEQITEVKINFLVQKFVKLTVLNTSGNTLEPSQSLGIKKDFTLTSNDPSKKIIVKIKLHYIINKEEKTKELTIKNL